MKRSNKSYYFAAILLQGAALVLEILPIGAVMVFATSPTERVTETYSYFSLLPLGYANITPMLTGILTITIILLGVISLFKLTKLQMQERSIYLQYHCFIVFTRSVSIRNC